MFINKYIIICLIFIGLGFAFFKVGYIPNFLIENEKDEYIRVCKKSYIGNNFVTNPNKMCKCIYNTVSNFLTKREFYGFLRSHNKGSTPFLFEMSEERELGLGLILFSSCAFK